MRKITAVSVSAVLGVVAACSSSGGSAPSLPGGRDGKAVLQQHHLLDADGRVQSGESAGPRQVQQALCSYLFGLPTDVGRVAELAAPVTLTDDSGFVVLGSNGDTYECTYETGGKPTLLLEIRTHPVTGKISGVGPVQVRSPGGLQGILVYRPGYDGKVMPKADATAWLTQATGRRQEPAGS